MPVKIVGEKNEEKYNQSFRNTVKSVRYMLGFIWREKRGKTFIALKGIFAVVNALLPVAATVLPGLVINELTGSRRIDTMAMYALLLASIPLVKEVINFTLTRYIREINLALTLTFAENFYFHTTRMDYETFEMPDIQVIKDRARETLWNTMSIVDQLSNLLSSLVSLIAVTSVVISLNPLILVVILIFVLIDALISQWIDRKQFRIRKKIDFNSRAIWGTRWMLESPYCAKDIRLFGVQKLLVGFFSERTKQTNKLEHKWQMNRDIPGLFSSVGGLIQQAGLFAYLIYLVIEKNLAIGSMTIYLAMTGQITGSLTRLLSSYLEMTKTSLRVHEMINFMNMPLTQHDSGDRTPEYDRSSVFEFRNVSFKYPGSENYALKDMNLTIRGDEKLCVVGANGSGKSTFIKLLTRLYRPESGEILLNGVNIYEYDYNKYQRLFSPVFQDAQTFYFSLKENIVLDSEYDQARLDDVCAKSGLTALVGKLNKGYDTQVGKWHDEEGFDPSGGEHQRITIARAVYHDSPVFLLDEPTAALDPVAEYEIYTQFNEMTADKTTVFITHRLSAVQLADRVAVFADGSLAEYGTHQQLYEKNGIYAEMFDKQAKFYVSNDKGA